MKRELKILFSQIVSAVKSVSRKSAVLLQINVSELPKRAEVLYSHLVFKTCCCFKSHFLRSSKLVLDAFPL